MRKQVATAVLLGVLAVVGLGAGGYVLGSETAPDGSDAAKARESSYRMAFDEAKRAAERTAELKGRGKGLDKGKMKGERAGTKNGGQAGEANAGEELAASQPAQAPGLVYDDQLPNGRPGYILPEEERSITCIGIDAATGECVGD